MSETSLEFGVHIMHSQLCKADANVADSSQRG